MRAKKAKALRRMAENVGGGIADVSYTAQPQQNSVGQTVGYSVILDDCVRRTYQTMKARYRQRSWK